MRFAYHVDDLARLAEPALRARALPPLATLAAVCLQRARLDLDMIPCLAAWPRELAALAAAPDGPDALAVLLRYILEVNPRAEPAPLLAFLLRTLDPLTKDRVMSTTMSYMDRLRAESRQEGRQEGRLAGEAAMLLRLLRQRFGLAVDAAVEQRVAAAAAEELERWGARVLTAPSLAALLAE